MRNVTQLTNKLMNMGYDSLVIKHRKTQIISKQINDVVEDVPVVYFEFEVVMLQRF